MLFLKTSNIVTPLHTYFIFRLCVRRCTVTILSKVKVALGAGARVVKGKVVLNLCYASWSSHLRTIALAVDCQNAV